MKLAVVVSSFPPEIGGMGQVAYDEAFAFAERGHSVTVFTLSYYGEIVEKKHPNLVVIRHSPRLKLGSAGQLFGVRKQLREFDLIHLHYPFYGGAEWVWLSQVPYVVTYHMDAKPETPLKNLVKSVYDFAFAKRILNKAKKVILVDKKYEFKLLKILDGNKIVQLSNPIDTKLFDPHVVHDLPTISTDLNLKKVYLFVGNLFKVKGVPMLIRAFAKANLQNSALVIVGGGSAEREYRKIAEEAGVQKSVLWLGKIEDRKLLSDLYCLANFTVISSLNESFSLVAAESLSSGTPVISPRLPSLKGKIEDNVSGILYDAGSESALAEAFVKASKILAEQRIEMGRKGRKVVEEMFGLKKHVEKLEEIYKQVV